MATIHHQVGIAAPVETVFSAVATPEGVSGWWTKTSGDGRPGGELVFGFNEVIVSVDVTGVIPGERIEWTVKGREGEWLNTRIVFEFEPAENQVLVNFRHADWRAATKMFAHCSTKWAVFLVSLKDYVETGTGRPFPNDVQINHFE